MIPDVGLDPILAACDPDIWPEEARRRRPTAASRAGLRWRADPPVRPLDDGLLDAAGPELKVVSNFAVGYDNIDVAACARRGVAIGNTPGALTETTADLAWTLMLAAARRVAEGDRYVRAGRWRRGAAVAPRGDVYGRRWGSSGSGGSGRPSRGGRPGSG